MQKFYFAERSRPSGLRCWMLFIVKLTNNWLSGRHMIGFENARPQKWVNFLKIFNGLFPVSLFFIFVFLTVLPMTGFELRTLVSKATAPQTKPQPLSPQRLSSLHACYFFLLVIKIYFKILSNGLGYTLLSDMFPVGVHQQQARPFREAEIKIPFEGTKILNCQSMRCNRYYIKKVKIHNLYSSRQI